MRADAWAHEPKGEHQIVCEHMELHGLGALQLAFEQLKKRLQAEGGSSRPRASACRRCRGASSIVTRSTGGLRDILKVLRRRAERMRP